VLESLNGFERVGLAAKLLTTQSHKFLLLLLLLFFYPLVELFKVGGLAGKTLHRDEGGEELC
jgi:hypothetical protein